MWGCMWVWLGGTLLLLVSDVPVCVRGEFGRCWVLRRHLWVCSWFRSWPGRPNAIWSPVFLLLVGGGCGCGGGVVVGVWLCVECCIVDASIFERLV